MEIDGKATEFYFRALSSWSGAAEKKVKCSAEDAEDAEDDDRGDDPMISSPVPPRPGAHLRIRQNSRSDRNNQQPAADPLPPPPPLVLQQQREGERESLIFPFASRPLNVGFNLAAEGGGGAAERHHRASINYVKIDTFESSPLGN